MATVAGGAVDAGWAERNLGLDYRAELGVRVAAPPDGPALRREIIEYDSESPTGAAFLARASAAPGGLSRFVPISWPKGLAPQPGKRPRGDSLPNADVLVVTWTVDEGHALSRVLTPGLDSHDDWMPYTKNFAPLSKLMQPDAPAVQSGRLGSYWTTVIGQREVTLFKSDSHMSQDGPKLANALVWKQIIEDTQPKLVITTGTGGAIDPSLQVGDVVVSRFVSFDCQRSFKRYNGDSYAASADPPSSMFATACSLFAANAGFLPNDNSRPPQIVTATAPNSGILTTDFFCIATTDNHYDLQGKSNLVEMGDAVLGMVCQQLGPTAPDWCIVRNVSNPEISSQGLPIDQQATLSADIYKAYGGWSSVCSSIVCWAIISAQ